MKRDFRSINHHLLSGAKAKAASLVLQTLNFIIIARILSAEQLSKFLLFTALVSLVVSITNAWSSNFQNKLTDAHGNAFNSHFTTLIIYTCTTCLVCVTVVAFASTVGLNLAPSLAALNSSASSIVFLFASAMAESLSFIQTAFFAAIGQSVRLGLQQLAGRAITTISIVAYAVSTSNPNGILIATIISLTNALPFFRQLYTHTVRTNLVRPSKHEIATFLRFAMINEISALSNFLVLNTIAQQKSNVLTNSFGICQRLLSPLATIVATGCRNLWPLLRSQPEKYIKEFERKSRLIKITALLASLAIGLGLKVFEVPIAAIFTLEAELPIIIIAIACTRNFYLSAAAPAYNLFAALDLEVRTLSTLLFLTGPLLLIYTLNKPEDKLAYIPITYIAATIICAVFEARVYRRFTNLTKQ